MAAPTLIRLMPSRTPISHRAVTGRFAHRIRASRIPTSPLASTQPQFGKGRIVSAKTTFEMPSIMKNTISSSVIVAVPCRQKPNQHGEDDGDELQPEMRHLPSADQAESPTDTADDKQPTQEDDHRRR